MIVILGLNAHHADSDASLVVDGQLIAAAAEERFRRTKHWAAFFPAHREQVPYAWDGGEPKVGVLYSDALCRLLGSPRTAQAPLDQRHHDSSFNENEPIVCQPSEALDCFLRTNKDVLVLGDHVLSRHA